MESTLSATRDLVAPLERAGSLCELFQATVRERTDEPALRTAGGEQELTPMMKLRRAPIARRYAEEIEELYR